MKEKVLQSSSCSCMHVYRDTSSLQSSSCSCTHGVYVTDVSIYRVSRGLHMDTFRSTRTFTRVALRGQRVGQSSRSHLRRQPVLLRQLLRQSRHSSSCERTWRQRWRTCTLTCWTRAYFRHQSIRLVLHYSRLGCQRRSHRAAGRNHRPPMCRVSWLTT